MITDLSADIKAALKVHPRDDAATLHLPARLDATYAMARGDARDWVTALLIP